MSKLLPKIKKDIKAVALYGAGKSNLGIVKYIKEHFPTISLTLRIDAAVPIPDSLTSLFDRVLLGDAAKMNFSEDVLFLSPSMRRDRPELIAAKNDGVIISSDAELFFEHFNSDAFLITGSDGKSTTTQLTAGIMKRSGYPSKPIGNYGVGLCSTLPADFFPAIELSSFQLMYLKPPTRRVCITNITPNHLNWHKDYDEYINAKANILNGDKEIVYDYDSPDARGLIFDRHSFVACSSYLTYDELRALASSCHYITKSADSILLDGKEYISLESATRKEDYNIKNYMLSLGLTLGYHCRAKAEELICSFTGLRHRCELVREHGGIRYINSSIDTSPERAIRTISALPDGDLALIMGGRSKGLDVSTLGILIARRAKFTVLMSDAITELSPYLKKENFATADNMKTAVGLAKEKLKSGTILLCPAYTSFDNYSSFEERGDDFRKITLDII